MKVPFKYSINNFGSRKLTTAITILGIALVVFVFSAVLMMAYGINKTLAATGSDKNVVVIRKGSNGEISSIVDGDARNIVKTLPYIAKTADGRQILSASPVAVINLAKPDGGMSNVMVRGMDNVITDLHPEVKITQGRMFNPSLRELIIGQSISDKFANADIGNEIKFAGDQWKIVGKFTTNGGGFDSEIWGDSRQLLDAFNRENSVSTITFRMDNPDNFAEIKNAFESDKRLKQYEPKIETAYFAEQSEFMATFIRILGIFVTVIFSIGATVGAMITMYAAVANRTKEIGTLRALGFSRRSILTVFLFESILISLIGGAIGLFLSSFLQFFTISTLNFDSFAELAFSFALSPSIIISSMIFAVAMGVLGGFLPSARAARLNILTALRTA